MKFAHMADVHIGSWRDPKLKDLSIEAFTRALKLCIDEHVDFIIVSGDLFNTALPGIDNLKTVVKELKHLNARNIPFYIIPGSHDFSPSGKTMIDVLEEAGLVKNVVKGTVVEGKLHLRFTIDEKTGAKITGMLGRRGSLEKHYYEQLDLESLEKEEGFKIFMFHSAIRELMPFDFKEMDSADISTLPKGFDYYAGGHVHIIKEYSDADYRNVVYPGPLFPASFSEMEKLASGGLYIYDDGKLRREEINVKNIFLIDIDANHKSAEELTQAMNDRIAKREFINTIVLLKLVGKMPSGKVSDIDFKDIFSRIYAKGAYFVMKSTSRVVSEEYEEIRIDEKGFEDVEDSLIKEHLQQIKVKGFDKDTEYRKTRELIALFSEEKHEGEKVYEYDERMKKSADRLLDL